MLEFIPTSLLRSDDFLDEVLAALGDYSSHRFNADTYSIRCEDFNRRRLAGQRSITVKEGVACR